MKFASDEELLRDLEEYFRMEYLIHAPEQRAAFLAVVKHLLAERCAYGELKRKALHHARKGDVHYTKKTLAKLGISPSRIDAILPLIHS